LIDFGSQFRVNAVDPMTAEQRRLVRGSYPTLKQVADLLGDIFYSRLFEMDLPLKYLFPPPT